MTQPPSATAHLPNSDLLPHPVIQRGGEQLSAEDLRAHLAALIRLENVGVFLGAGASKPAGGKVMKDLWLEFLNSDRNNAIWLAENEYIETHQSNPSSYDGNEPSSVPNVESLLDKLEIARQARIHPPSKNRRETDLERTIEALNRHIIAAGILDKEKWQEPEKVSSNLNHHRKLLQRVVGARQAGQPSPWIFTTNYDLAIEWAAESIPLYLHTGFSGIHNRTFTPQSFDLGLRNASARGEARFGCNDCYLAKLHGSLTWQKVNDVDFRELSASEAWPGIQKIIENAARAQNRIMVFPRAAKYLQTVGYLSGELFRRFSDFLARPQTALLIVGYSFSDQHINRLLRSALLNPTLQIIIFFPEFTGDTNTEALNSTIREIVNLQSPRITLVGGGESAFLDRAADLLPDPILFDFSEREMRERLSSETNNDSSGNNE